ncbi:MAG: SUMF1/EgtB/PvdO family nonheme iron enzyme [Planctomycetes bacterium]|nr:SUMF1/EgtB/PvdO family nonheme iron enzyme [Planctomycetota bacterium]
MDRETWSEVKETFEAIRDLPRDEQLTFLDRRLGRDSQTRQEVERLLAAHGDTSDFLEPPPARALVQANPGLQRNWIGARLSSYRIVRVLGSGGMGTVYEAVQDDPSRTVALKVTHSASPEVIRRFRYESELLARLNHPGIAPIYEAGVEACSDGTKLPWFAMEYLPGALSILDYAATEALDVHGRIELFAQVLDAIRHGHRSGILHRDLKPANILVDPAGRVRVIDFGVARSLHVASHEDVHRTNPGELIGTLHYMSPEQVGETHRAPDVRSDIYALGIVLYELLGGKAPHAFDNRTFLEIVHAIRDEEPVPLHEHHPEVPRELGWIVQRAMAKEPDRRYGSVEEFAGDLARYERNEPVLAGPPTRLYSLTKFVRRHRLTVAFALVLCLTALAAAVGIGVFAWKAEQQRRLAESKNADYDRLAVVEALRAAQEEAKAPIAPWPSNAGKIRRWLNERALPILQKVRTVEETVRTLRGRALEPTEEHLVQERAQHPRAEELAFLEAKYRALAHADRVRRGQAEPLAVPRSALPVPVTLKAFHQWVNDRVRDERTLYGHEAEGLALARDSWERVRERGYGSRERQYYGGMLASALLANGLVDEAREVIREAFRDADETPDLPESRETIERRIQQLESPEASHALMRLEREVNALRREVSRQTVWEFASDADRFLHEVLTAFLEDVRDFERVEVPRVRERLAWAESIEERSIVRHRARWEEARTALRRADDVVASVDYRARPIDLTAQVGLVPIGMNPRTKLWEFYHLRSAADPDVIPTHAPDGTIALDEGSGFVFVLVPGGTFVMGSQKDDPGGPNYDAFSAGNETPCRVELDAYFLSRYECTQAQWIRLSEGENPSTAPIGGSNYLGRPVTGMHPVERVSWDRAIDVLGWCGLTLPTESQWEYAARAHTTTPWWTGDDVASLNGRVNLADVTLSKTHARSHPAIQRDLDDGHAIHAPVNALAANPWGLYHVIGNVEEHCLDRYGSYGLPRRSGDALRTPHETRPHVCRGGSAFAPPLYARSAGPRHAVDPTEATIDLGVRPARRVVLR